MKVAVLGSINLDITAYLTSPREEGVTTTARNGGIDVGGKGFNQAIAATRLSAEHVQVKFFGPIGTDGFGNAVEDFVRRSKLDAKLARITTHTGIASIDVNPAGQNSIVVVPGANHALRFEFVKSSLEQFEPRILLLQGELDSEATLNALRWAKEKQVFTMLDPAPAANITPEMLALADLVTPNEEEFAYLVNTYAGEGPTGHTTFPTFGRGANSDECILSFMKKLKLRRLIITRGSKGCRYAQLENISIPFGENPSTESIHKEFTATQAIVSDTTAAGDTFNGALAAYLACQVAHGGIRSFSDAVTFANKAASVSVTRKGASSSIPYLHEFPEYKFLNQKIHQ